ncbi:enoyl-CoA hydratase/isomerase family protein [Acidiphilium sp. AL]|uniref:enoyl-CoA hydratase/isomerase family protein n=1 Tax=Acidiphilium sp. AL TaxID=2871704 RepID=UPI0021CB97C1|nr:enoyl-CoA hydratase/isomerase family protein [Acidiphilium sp. AL]MCU4161950.1 enoyl-CoA hydratase/isomerase family protein [Acidiphilium sp. AL]
MSAVEVLPPDERGLCHVILNRPDRANALNVELVEALLACLEAATGDGTKLLILRGAGANFCGGFDLSGYEAESDGDLALRFIRIEQVLQRLSSAPFLSVACIHGAAYGAGADLVAACDYRLGAESSRFRFPGYRFGVALGTRRLAAIIGATVAHDILISGRVMQADEALTCGLITHCLDGHAADAEIDRIEKGMVALDTLSVATLVANARRPSDGADYNLAMLVRSVARPGLRERLRHYAETLPSAKAR